MTQKWEKIRHCYHLSHLFLFLFDSAWQLAEKKALVEKGSIYLEKYKHSFPFLPDCFRDWCGRRDSNSHGSPRHPLKMVCLPIPPRPPINADFTRVFLLTRSTFLSIHNQFSQVNIVFNWMESIFFLPNYRFYGSVF